MNLVLLIILLSVVVTSTVEVLKLAKPFLAQMIPEKFSKFKEKFLAFKIGYPLAITLGMLTAFLWQVGLVESIGQLIGLQDIVPEGAKVLDTFFAGIALSQGSGYIVSVWEKNKEAKKYFEENKDK